MAQKSLVKVRYRTVAIAATSLILLGALVQPATALADTTRADFAFVPPASSPSFPDMAIAIVRPIISGSLGSAAPADRGHHRLLAQFTRAAAVDLGKIVIAKGFRTSGSYPSLAKISDAEKQHASLLLAPDFHLNLTSADGKSVITGGVALAFIEPDTSEKIWVKQVALTPFSLPAIGKFDDAALATLLQAYYPALMRQIWDQIDPINIRMLAIKLVGD